MTYTTYSDTTAPNGFVNGVTPLSATNMEAFRDFCKAGWFDSQITSNGSGVETVVGLVAGTSGLTENGPLLLPYPSVQTLSNNSTITLNTGPLIVVTTSANVTGIIMSAGATAGQVVFVYNNASAGTVTFAASGSRVRNGSNITIGVGRICVAIWDGSNWATADCA